VPIVAPILLADPGANVTAVWLGVMIGLNIQTSFLTPPFGFALFYLRGVAPPEVKTTDIYRGAVAFILLQLVGLTIAGTYPSLVNYLPNRTYLTSDTAPPPMNPRFQRCLEEDLFAYYDEYRTELEAQISVAANLDLSVLPASYRDKLSTSVEQASKTFATVEDVRHADRALAQYAQTYRPIHVQARLAQRGVHVIDGKLSALKHAIDRLQRFDEPADGQIAELRSQADQLNAKRTALLGEFPAGWKAAREQFESLSNAELTARRRYRSTVDEAYEGLSQVRNVIGSSAELDILRADVSGLQRAVDALDESAAMDTIKVLESAVGAVAGAGKIRSNLSKARRALRGNSPDRDKAAKFLLLANDELIEEVRWRTQAGKTLNTPLSVYDQAIALSIGIRQQSRLTEAQAGAISMCQSAHRDVSLNF
jgi:hypothetical protein